MSGRVSLFIRQDRKGDAVDGGTVPPTKEIISDFSVAVEKMLCLFCQSQDRKVEDVCQHLKIRQCLGVHLKGWRRG